MDIDMNDKTGINGIGIKNPKGCSSLDKKTFRQGVYVHILFIKGHTNNYAYSSNKYI
jgi:hypothetical protein